MQHTGSNRFCNQCGCANTLTAKFCRGCGHHMSLLTTNLMQGHALGAASSTTGHTGLLTGTLHHGQYLIVRPLGQGGMGAVYLAQDLTFGGRLVAVKEMSQGHLQPDEQAVAADAFRREALLLASLMHPNLPRIYGQFTDTGRLYLVMDFIEGETLSDRLNRSGGKLPVEQALDIGIQLCAVLDYLHTRQPPVIFRDMKPANVILTPTGHVYLIDFGIARHFKPGQSRDTTALGSSGYAAPEQYGKAQTTARADIYGLGATLHQLITGDDPSESPFHFAPPQLRNQPALAGLDTLLMSMVSVESNQRPESAAIVRQELQRIASTSVRPPSISHAATGSTSSSLPQPAQRKASSVQGWSGAGGPRQVTLLYAPADCALAQELDLQIHAAAASLGMELEVWHNGCDPSYVLTLPQAWAKRLWESDLFLPLVSAHLWADQTIWEYVEQIAETQPAERILPIWVRPCFLDQGTFKGIEVIPQRPVASSSRKGREATWLQITGAIFQALKTVSPACPPRSPSMPPAVEVSSRVADAVSPSPIPAFQTSTAYTMPVYHRTPSRGTPPTSKQWEVTLLYAPEDNAWLKPVTRLFTTMQQTLLRSLGIHFVLHHGSEGLPPSDAFLQERIAASRLTLALVSPDFLASEWMDRYDQAQFWLSGRGHHIIPVLIRACQWSGGQPIPREGAIKTPSNDAAWAKVSEEVTTILRTYYPSEMPQRRITPWS